MATQVESAADTEHERQRLVMELNAEQGQDWQEQNKPGSFGCHELLDRTSTAAHTVEEYVLSHPACVQNLEWFSLAEQAAAALHELYQRIGAEHLGEKSDTNDKPSPLRKENTMRKTLLSVVAAASCLLVGCGVKVKTPGTTVEVGPGGVKVETPGTKVNVSPTEGVQVDTPEADVNVSPKEGVEVKTPETEVKAGPKKD